MLLPVRGKNNTIRGCSRHRVLIIGKNNSIICKSKLGRGVKISIIGNNNELLIEEGCIIKIAHFKLEELNNKIMVKAGTTIEEAHLAVSEEGTEIVIGKDCMLSTNIRITTSDSHSILNLIDRKRINPAKSIIIGDHCWIGTRVTINKGVRIEDNSVIASNSLVTKSFPANVIIGGIPAKVLRNGITWLRERV